MARAFLSLALAALVIPVAVGAMALVHGCGPDGARLSPFERARLHAHEVCRRLHALRGPDGWHERVADAGETDEWGHPLRVEYRRFVEDGWDHEAVAVTGAGPDGAWGTEDDVKAVLYVARPAKQAQPPCEISR